MTDWGAQGVFWTGQPGDEIQRLDDMSDYGCEPVFAGDMEAALHVARNGFPWLLYEQDHDPDAHWFVTAHPTREDAIDAMTRIVPDTTLFIFDATAVGELASRPDGNGFLAPDGAIVAD